MYVDAIQYNNQIVVWVRDELGTLETYIEPAPFYCFQATQAETNLKSIFGHKVHKVEFDSKMDFRNFVESRSLIFESDLSPLHKFLSDNFYGLDGPVNKGYFDIEVDFDLSQNRGYPTPENPFGAVNSISLFDDSRQEYHIIMLTSDFSIILKDEHEGLPVHNHHCLSEKELLNKFVEIIEDLDIISAWNGDGFDIPYLLARCEVVYGQTEGRTKLCREGFSVQYREFVNEFGMDAVQCRLVGRMHLDLMQVYKKFTKNTTGELASYRLDMVAEKELKMNKLEFAGDLGQLYRTDPKKFFEYSLHDSRLLKLLDDKKKFLMLAVTMARRATIRFDEILGSIKYLEMSIRNYCHHDRKEPCVLPDRKENEKIGKFEGAFVMEVATGVYDWTQSIDLAALYPSTIIALNISPETYILQCKNGHTDFLEIVQKTEAPVTLYYVADGEAIELKAKDINDWMRENSLTISANGSLFDNTFIGIIPEVLMVWKKARKEYKNKYLACEKQAEETADETLRAKLHAEAHIAFMINEALKLSNNSLYGAISNPYSRFFNLDCAKSVTLSGKEIVKYQAKMVENIMSEPT